ncbi:hypothetical protein ACFL2H_09130 [Planctomycetota bacterium]
MKWLEKLVYKLERLIDPIAVPNLGLVLIVGQIICYLAMRFDPDLYGQFLLITPAVRQGEVWRLFTFIFAIPPNTGPLWAIIGWWFFHFASSMVERAWGTARFNLYVLVGYLATVVAAFAFPEFPATTLFLVESVFLALATLHPKLVIRVMFILPVEIRWLAYLAWIGTIYTLITVAPLRGLIIAGIFNYLVFFTPMHLQRLKDYRRRAEWQQKTAVMKAKPRHTCEVCGVDSNTDPEIDFRYCSQCTGAKAYCEQHLRNHEHVVKSGD